MDKRPNSRYNVSISRFLFQKEAKIMRKCSTWNMSGQYKKGSE
nr:MAG TPA: hypothetical protein [Caudoviricetes sp.]